MVFSGKYISFDFETFEGTVDKDDRTLVHFMQKNPDYDEFEDLYNLTSEDLHHLEHIEEFFIYTGEADALELNPVKIETLSFRNFGISGQEDIDETIDYSDSEIIKNFKFEE